MSRSNQTGDRLKVALSTREYPPEVYGGPGVHVEYLAKELSKHVDLTVHCQGADRPTAVAHRPWDRLKNTNPALQTISTGLSMVAEMGSVDLVHSHTWYANMAAHLASLLYGIPHVVTMHSLEPLRPWKAEQLGLCNESCCGLVFWALPDVPWESVAPMLPAGGDSAPVRRTVDDDTAVLLVAISAATVNFRLAGENQLNGVFRARHRGFGRERQRD